MSEFQNDNVGDCEPSVENDVGRDSDDDDNENKFDEWIEDDDIISIRSFFSEKTFRSLSELVEYEVANYDFNILDLLQSMDDEDLVRIMTINFIRDQVQNAEDCNGDFIRSLEAIIKDAVFLQNEKYLRPTFEDDALIPEILNFFESKRIEE